MAEKDLQKGSIIEVIGEFINISHPIISNNISTRLAAAKAAAGTAATVLDNNGFTDGDDILWGAVGDAKTEAGVLTTVGTRAGELDVVVAGAFAHELDCPITKLNEDQITIFDAADDSEIATVSIQWDKSFTQYEVAAAKQSATGYYVAYTDGTNTGPVSDTVTSSGLADNSVYNMALNGLSLIDEDEGGRFDEKWMINEANNCQDAIRNFTNAKGIAKDWSWELAQDETSISLTENENKYALSGLSFTLKKADTKQAIQSVKIGSTPLKWIDIDEYDEDMKNSIRTAVKTAITADDTSIVLDDTFEFAEAGSVFIGADTIAYTGNTEATGTLTGCTDVDNDHAVDATVWQNATPALPTKYTVFDGYIYLNAPVDTDYVGFKLKIRGLQVLTRMADLSDTTVIPFYYIYQYWYAGRAEFRQGNTEEGKFWMSMFNKYLAQEARRDVVPLFEEGEYYNTDIEEVN